MSKSEPKPIIITLFYMDGCPPCRRFKTEWDIMVNNKETNKNFNFVKYESRENIPESEIYIDGKNIIAEGFPTIKVKVFEQQHVYVHNERTSKGIFTFIKRILQKYSSVDISR